MKRTYMLMSALLTCALTSFALSASALAGAEDGAPIARAARSATVALHGTSLGKILVDASGFTLYAFTRDSHAKNSCLKVSGCAAVWPALTVGSSPTAGPGVRASLLSSIRLPAGTRQVTYAGHPLYTYSESTERAETSYVGVSRFGGKWVALNATGAFVR